MYTDQTFKVKGVVPLMMHNIDLANPLSTAAKSVKRFSSKRKKTEEDLIALSRAEFLGGLYHDARGYWIPARAWEAALVAAAKQTKRGKVATAGLYVGDDSVLAFAGPKDPEARFEDPSCVDVRAVRVSSARVMRTRPVFRDWSCAVTISLNTSLIEPHELREWMALVGRQIGVLEYRPRFGRFDLV